ncbi:MAG: PucR family transcriptional regulator [Eubacterium sp.]|nr:PucR family transcriptional regulator [Eubacterium sp.]
MRTTVSRVLDILSFCHPLVYNSRQKIQNERKSTDGEKAEFDSSRIFCAYRSQEIRIPEEEMYLYICINDTNMREVPLFRTCSTILIDADYTKEQIESTLHCGVLFENSFNSILSELFNRVYLGTDLRALLEQASDILGNPLAIFDEEGNLLANTIPQKDQKKLTAKTKEFCASPAQLGDSIARKANLGNKEELIYCHQWTNNQCIRTLVTYNTNRPFLSWDLRYIETLILILDTYARQSFYVLWEMATPEEKYMFHLLGGSTAGQRYIPLNAPQHAFPERMCLVLVQSEYRRPLDIVRLRKSCRTLFSSVPILVKEDWGILLFDYMECAARDSEVMADLTEFLTENHLYASVSNCFSDIKELPEYFNQAAKVFEMIHDFSDEKRMVRYADSIIDYMLELCRREISLEELYHPAYIILMEYDRQYGTRYREFLETYLKYSTMAECAKGEKVHYNTIKYRVAQIRNITGVDLNDRETVLALAVSVRIYHLRNGFV